MAPDAAPPSDVEVTHCRQDRGRGSASKKSGCGQVDRGKIDLGFSAARARCRGHEIPSGSATHGCRKRTQNGIIRAPMACSASRASRDIYCLWIKYQFTSHKECRLRGMNVGVRRRRRCANRAEISQASRTIPGYRLKILYLLSSSPPICFWL